MPIWKAVTLIDECSGLAEGGHASQVLTTQSILTVSSFIDECLQHLQVNLTEPAYIKTALARF